MTKTVTDIPEYEHMLCSYYRLGKTIILTEYKNKYSVYKITYSFFKRTPKMKRIIEQESATEVMCFLVAVIQHWKKLN